MKTRLLFVLLMLMIIDPAFADTASRARVLSTADGPDVVYMNRLKSASWHSLSSDERALRMNRDYDYPFYPVSSSTVVVPLTTHEIQILRRAEDSQRARADANFKAMSADERRRFIQANYGAFRAGLEPRPLSIR